MTNHNLSDYLKSKYSFSQKTITEISKSDNGKGSLVECDKKMYCFDDISTDIYSKDKPASMDGIIVIGKEIFLVEFKSGFRQLITKKNYDPQRMICPRYESKCSKTKKKCSDFEIPKLKEKKCRETGKICFKSVNYCEDYGKQFLNLKEKEKNELYQSIRMKAIESYITLEKEIFPLCAESKKSLKLNLVIVIDGNGDDANVYMIEDLSGKETLRQISDKENDFFKLKESLAKYERKKDCNGNDYYYDTVKVMNPTEFKRFAEERFIV